MRNWFEIKADAQKAEVYLYGYIGQDAWDDDAKSAADFVKEIEPYSALPLTVRINSGGGSAFDGIAIYNAIKRRQAETITCIDALAASAAGIIAMAGDRVVMCEGAQFMAHKAWAVAAGNSFELTKTVAALESLDSELASIYAKKTGIDSAACLELMAQETWIGSARALSEGWVDEVDEGVGARKAACLDELTIKQLKSNIPDGFLASPEAGNNTETTPDKPSAQGAAGESLRGDEPRLDVEPTDIVEPGVRVVALASGIYEIKENN